MALVCIAGTGVKVRFVCSLGSLRLVGRSSAHVRGAWFTWKALPQGAATQYEQLCWIKLSTCTTLLT